jgi:hypothetical protein
VNRALFALLASVIVGSALGESTEPTRIRITTWNLQWFPSGSAHDATPEAQAQRIAATADVLRPISLFNAVPTGNPDGQCLKSEHGFSTTETNS